MSSTFNKEQALTYIAQGEKVKYRHWKQGLYICKDEYGNIVNQDGDSFDFNCFDGPGGDYKLYTPPKEEDHFNMGFMDAIEAHTKLGYRVGRGVAGSNTSVYLKPGVEYPVWETGHPVSYHAMKQKDWRTFGKWEDEAE